MPGLGMGIGGIPMPWKVAHQPLPGTPLLPMAAAQLPKQHGAQPEEAPQGPGLHHRVAGRDVIQQLKAKDPVTSRTVLRMVLQEPREWMGMDENGCHFVAVPLPCCRTLDSWGPHSKHELQWKSFFWWHTYSAIGWLHTGILLGTWHARLVEPTPSFQSHLANCTKKLPVEHSRVGTPEWGG